MFYLARKDNEVVMSKSKEELFTLYSLVPEKEVSDQDMLLVNGLARIIDGEIFLGKTDDEKEREAEISRLTLEEARLQAELEAKDYKVIKASESGLVLAEEDPTLHERRGWCRKRINEIRERLAELEA